MISIRQVMFGGKQCSRGLLETSERMVLTIVMLLAAAALAKDDEDCQLYLAPSQLKENGEFFS
jgi:hypothetical protein